jgi:DNA-binding transcriptional regulator YiaG
LGGRSAYWESKAVSTKRTTDHTAKGGRPPALAIVGEKITELRDETSQATFARLTKLSIDVVQRAERGEATARTIRKLCKYAKSKGFSLTPDTLRKNTPQKTAKT